MDQRVLEDQRLARLQVHLLRTLDLPCTTSQQQTPSRFLSHRKAAVGLTAFRDHLLLERVPNHAFVRCWDADLRPIQRRLLS